MNPVTKQADKINKMLNGFSDETLAEVVDFVEFLSEKEQKRKAFTERVLKIERESDTVCFDSANDAMKAIKNLDE